jgi:hypothetical protein
VSNGEATAPMRQPFDGVKGSADSVELRSRAEKLTSFPAVRAKVRAGADERAATRSTNCDGRGGPKVPDDADDKWTQTQAVLRRAQDPARYTGFLDEDGADAPARAAVRPTSRASGNGSGASSNIEARQPALGGVAARLAAVLTDDPDDEDLADGSQNDTKKRPPGHPSADEVVSGRPAPGGKVSPPALPRVPHHRLRSPVLRAPASTEWTTFGDPDPHRVAHYLAHSADLTLNGGLQVALAAGPAVCALAERYALRRIGGSSAASITAAAAAVAELGRTTPPHELTGTGRPNTGRPNTGRTAARKPDAVQPGFAGLAEATAWLAGVEPAKVEPAKVEPAKVEPEPAETLPPRGRLSRMLRPDPTARALLRLLTALAAPRAGRRWPHVATAIPALLNRPTRIVVGLLWLGAITGCTGVVTALAQSPHVMNLLVPLAAVSLAVTFALAAGFGTVLVAGQAIRSAVRETFSSGGFASDRLGAVDGATRHSPTRLDEKTPALFDWLADRLDDLAGVPAAVTSTERYAVTFGELWLGRMGGRATTDVHALRRAAADPRRRVVDLLLVTTDLSAGRPRLLPFGVAERPGKITATRFLFCRSCLVGLVPTRVVDQMVLMSPGATVQAECPRHPQEPLHDLPEPWDLPIALAVRLSGATPGLFQPVPLYAPGPERSTVRTHWFGDGGLTGGMPARAFDRPLPRWPTFALGTVHDPEGEDVLAPEQNALPVDRWRPISNPTGLATALMGAVVGWRDALREQDPALGGGFAAVRAGVEPLLLLEDTQLDAQIGELAVRGYRAGETLRERFSAPDTPNSSNSSNTPNTPNTSNKMDAADGAAGRSRTDRFRWIRLRSTLSEYRQLSLSIGTSLPVYTDLALGYRVPAELSGWFSPPLAPGQADPAWGDAVAAITHLRSLSEGGVLDWDTDWGAPPSDPHRHLT